MRSIRQWFSHEAGHSAGPELLLALFILLATGHPSTAAAQSAGAVPVAPTQASVSKLYLPLVGRRL
jgi:hypothetical protein